MNGRTPEKCNSIPCPGRKTGWVLILVLLLSGLSLIHQICRNNRLSIEATSRTDLKDQYVRLQQEADEYRRFIGAVSVVGSEEIKDLLAVLEQKFEKAGISDLIREIEPSGEHHAGGFSVETVRIKLSGVPADRLPVLFSILETESPYLRIIDIDISRRAESEVFLDIFMTLQRWKLAASHA